MKPKMEVARRREFAAGFRRVNYRRAWNYVVALGWLECRLIVFKGGTA